MGLHDESANSPQLNAMQRCPKCGKDRHVRRKTLLIGKESPLQMFEEDRVGYRRKDQLAVDEVLPGVLPDPPLSQFMDGFYCDTCGIGFASDKILISAASKRPRANGPA
ncbi:MAG: hypothetical protein LBE21_05350 [Pseudomonadales bacterium]|jgi:hypothetical protein|nr:hypothetical protein [Pseudomonadales bacterium]